MLQKLADGAIETVTITITFVILILFAKEAGADWLIDEIMSTFNIILWASGIGTFFAILYFVSNTFE
jgi:hypothetical protein